MPPDPAGAGQDRPPGDVPRPPGPRITCRGCRHYYVTWDPRLPHGCRFMNFKSRQHPALVVYEASGLECQAFHARGA
ncbi:MAG: hypothetical protein ACRDGF_00410 [Chloroflexota bacterium]